MRKHPSRPLAILQKVRPDEGPLEESGQDSTKVSKAIPIGVYEEYGRDGEAEKSNRPYKPDTSLLGSRTILDSSALWVGTS